VSEVAQILARSAIAAGRRATETIMAGAAGVPPALATDVEAQVARVVYQDPMLLSWRVWGGFWSFVTGLLVVPEVQAAIHGLVGQLVPVAYLPLATALLGAMWPLISKWRDPRPVRGAAA
jgi:hypothetical protein